ncbi:MAG: ComF family protein [Gammaproteobacteria bacterium]
MVYKPFAPILDAVLPPRCRSCAEVLDVGMVCAPCTAAMPWNADACGRCALPLPAAGTCPRCLARAPRFDAAWAAFRLEPPIQQFVHRLKYHADFALAALLGELMATRLRAGAPPLPQLLVPVPLHPRRLMQRGYNQALELARAVGTRCGIPLAMQATRRVRATDDQIGQSAAARRRNMRRAFVVEQDLSGLHIALVDDVMTTGATLDELARVCRAAGAARIEAWAVARTP